MNVKPTDEQWQKILPILKSFPEIRLGAGRDCRRFIEAVIPSRINSEIRRTIDTELYKERHLIECCIGKLKHFRRVFSRFDKLAKNYLSFVQFASTIIWLR
ncbi:MAG: hypothetical protein ACR2N3_10950 [Pyrinomonadaceae bacterium]